MTPDEARKMLLGMFEKHDIDPHKVLKNSFDNYGYEEFVTDADGKKQIDRVSGTARTIKRMWPSGAFGTVALSLDALSTGTSKVAGIMAGSTGHLIDKLSEGGKVTASDIYPNQYPADAAILLLRVFVDNPTTENRNNYIDARTGLTPELLDEHDARYARMYGKDTMQELEK